MSLTRQQIRATGRRAISEHVAHNTKLPRRERREMARRLEREGWKKRNQEAFYQMKQRFERVEQVLVT